MPTYPIHVSWIGAGLREDQQAVIRRVAGQVEEQVHAIGSDLVGECLIGNGRWPAARLSDAAAIRSVRSSRVEPVS